MKSWVKLKWPPNLILGVHAVRGVEKICYCSALVGQFGWSNISRSYFKHFLCCSHDKFQLNKMKNTVEIFEIIEI